ncbi:MAG: DUF3471 domain-containing protein, partial [Gemmatimonadota bacterium]
VSGTRPSLPLERYAGSYADSLNGTVRVTVEGGALRAVWGKSYAGPLEHWHYDTFMARWEDRRAGSAPLTFVLDARGRVAELRVRGAAFGRVPDRSR